MAVKLEFNACHLASIKSSFELFNGCQLAVIKRWFLSLSLSDRQLITVILLCNIQSVQATFAQGFVLGSRDF